MEPEAANGESRRETRALVVRNTLNLTVSQALTVPLALWVNAVAGRCLGAEAFGMLYLAGTLCGFGFLAVGWGHDGAIPAAVARDQASAGRVLASSLAWRIVASVAVFLLLSAICHGLGYGPEMQWVLGLVALASLVTSLASAGKDTVRGLERTDIPAYAHVGQQLLTALIVVPVLLLGGGTHGYLLGQVVAAGVVLVALGWALRRLGLHATGASWVTVKQLFTNGTPFVVFGLAMTLQPNIDAIFLSKLAPAEAMGWYAVSRRLIGVLVLPASALTEALFPTLCRLHGSDPPAFQRATSGALRGIAVLVMPIALSCALFPETAIALFSRESFEPAEDNLRVLSLFVFLVYFSMPLGTCILAAGRQRAWSIVQSLCVVVSLVLDPLLVPWFQARTGNGSLGLCVATTFSELVVVGCGLVLVPRGVLDRGFFRTMSSATLAGAAMVALALVARPLTVWVVAPLSLVAYAIVLTLSGGIDREHVAAVRGFVRRKFSGSAGNAG